MRCTNCYNELPLEIAYCPTCSFPVVGARVKPKAEVVVAQSAPLSANLAVASRPNGTKSNGATPDSHVMTATVTEEPRPTVNESSELSRENGQLTPESVAAGPDSDEQSEPPEMDTVDTGTTAAAPAGNAANYSAGGVRHPDYGNLAGRSKTGERSATASRNGTRSGSSSNTGSRPKPITKPLKRITQEEARRQRLLKRVKIALYLMLVAGAGYYVLSAAGMLSSTPKPAESMSAMAALRNLASGQDGQTVDQRLTQMVADAKKAGDLTRFQGWTTKPILGDSSTVIVAFTYETKQGKQSAEWLANLSKRTYSPQTDLAKQVYSGESSGDKTDTSH